MLDNSVKEGDWIRYTFDRNNYSKIKLMLGVAYRIVEVSYRSTHSTEGSFPSSVLIRDDAGELVWFSPLRFERVIPPTVEVLY